MVAGCRRIIYRNALQRTPCGGGYEILLTRTGTGQLVQVNAIEACVAGNGASALLSSSSVGQIRSCCCCVESSEDNVRVVVTQLKRDSNISQMGDTRSYTSFIRHRHCFEIFAGPYSPEILLRGESLSSSPMTDTAVLKTEITWRSFPFYILKSHFN